MSPDKPFGQIHLGTCLPHPAPWLVFLYNHLISPSSYVLVYVLLVCFLPLLPSTANVSPPRYPSLLFAFLPIVEF